VVNNTQERLEHEERYDDKADYWVAFVEQVGVERNVDSKTHSGDCDGIRQQLGTGVEPYQAWEAEETQGHGTEGE